MVPEPTPSDGSTPSAPDGFFSFVAGLYAAAVLGPAVTVAAAVFLTTDAGTLFVALLGASVAFVVAGAFAASRSPGLPAWLGRQFAGWALVPPAAYAAVLLAAVGGWTSLPGAAVGVSLAGTAVSGFVGLGLVVMAHNRYTRTALADATAYADFEARRPGRDRRRSTAAGVALLAVALASLVADVAFGVGPPVRWLGTGLPGFGAVLVATAGQKRTVEVTDAGLVVRRPVHAYVHPWWAFDGYAVSADALVVSRSSWWRLDVRCDPEDVEDVATVVDALGRFLPEEAG